MYHISWTGYPAPAIYNLPVQFLKKLPGQGGGILMKNDDLYGINIMRYISQHEAYLQEKMSTACDYESLLKYHDKKIQWLQHERLVHLLVTMLVAMLFMFLFVLLILIKYSLPVIALLAIVAVLLIAYILHYFRLENKTQHWYRLSDEIYQKIATK
jgi:ABC-type multidrug transport system fused ATPase/permease subunit